jgi:hypothetical protein
VAAKKTRRIGQIKHIPKKKEPEVIEHDTVHFGKLKTVNDEDFERIKKEGNSQGMLKRLYEKQQQFYAPFVEQMQGLTFAEKKMMYKNERKRRIERGDRKKDFYVIDVIDPLPISTDEEKPTVNDVAIAAHSPGIQTKAAALGTPTAITKKTYDDSILAHKFGEDFKEKISDQFDDPYAEKDKWRWHDGFRTNGAAQACLVVRSEFTLGAEYTDTALDTNKFFSRNEREAEAADVERINKVPLYKWFKKMCDKFDRDLKFNYWAQGGLIQKWEYGRSAIIVQDDPKTGLPVALKLLNSMRLGRIFVDILTWEVKAVEYVDYEPPENIILAENMIYLVNKNFHISPGTLHFGLSDYEPIRDVLESDVLIESIDIKEINKRLWAAMILIKVFSEDQEAVTKLKTALKTGKSVFATIDYEAQQIKIEHDLPALLDERKENRDKIFNDLQVPKVVGFGGSDAGSKSEASIVAHGWNSGPLAKQKLLVRGDFEEQYYNRNLEKLAKYRAKYHKITKAEIKEKVDELEKGREEDLLFEPKEPKDERELLIFLLAQDVVDWPFKLKMNMREIDFSTPIEKAALATTLTAAQIIQQEKALEIMGYQDEIDKLKQNSELDMQTTDVVKQLFEDGTDTSKMTVKEVFDLLMAKTKDMAGGGIPPKQKLGPDGKPIPEGKSSVPTLESIKKGQEAKGGGLGVSPGDFVRRITARTKLPSPKTGVTTSE